MELSERLQELRKLAAYTQEELADILGVSRQALSKWKNQQDVLKEPFIFRDTCLFTDVLGQFFISLLMNLLFIIAMNGDIWIKKIININKRGLLHYEQNYDY